MSTRQYGINTSNFKAPQLPVYPKNPAQLHADRVAAAHQLPETRGANPTHEPDIAANPNVEVSSTKGMN